MARPSDEQQRALAGLLGLGDHSARKSHYPELAARLDEVAPAAADDEAGEDEQQARELELLPPLHRMALNAQKIMKLPDIVPSAQG